MCFETRTCSAKLLQVSIVSAYVEDEKVMSATHVTAMDEEKATGTEEKEDSEEHEKQSSSGSSHAEYQDPSGGGDEVRFFDDAAARFVSVVSNTIKFTVRPRLRKLIEGKLREGAAANDCRDKNHRDDGHSSRHHTCSI